MNYNYNTDFNNIYNLYITEAKIPFDKRREVKRGMEKKYGRSITKPYTFGFDIEFRPYIDDDDIVENLKYYISSTDEEYIEYIKDNVIDVSEPEYETIEGWEYDNPEPDYDDYEGDDDSEYNKDYNKWSEERENYEETINEYQFSIEYHIQNEDTFTQYLQYLIRSGTAENMYPDIFNVSYLDYIIYEVSEKIKSIYGDSDSDLDDVGKEWDVHEDEAGVVEIASPVLTTKDIPKVIEVLEEIKTMELEAKNNTSAHIHIGVPDSFDYFDLMVLYDLVDEEYIYKLQPNRKRSYTNFKEKFFRGFGKDITNRFEEGENIPIDELNSSYVEKHMGVNISKVSQHIKNIKSKNEKSKGGFGKTVEFRYLSSEIFDGRNGIKSFLEFIDYFMLLMKTAENRNQFYFSDISYDNNQKYVVQRVSSNTIRYFKNTGKQLGYKASDLKQTYIKKDERDKYVKMMNNIASRLKYVFKDEDLNVPNFKNMSVKNMIEWWLQSPLHAYTFIAEIPLNHNLDIPYKKFADKIQEDFLVSLRLMDLGYRSVENIGRLKKLEKQILADPLNMGDDFKKMLMRNYLRYIIHKTKFNWNNLELDLSELFTDEDSYEKDFRLLISELDKTEKIDK